MVSVSAPKRAHETSDSDSGTSSFDLNLPEFPIDDNILTDILSEDTLSLFPCDDAQSTALDNFICDRTSFSGNSETPVYSAFRQYVQQKNSTSKLYLNAPESPFSTLSNSITSTSSLIDFTSPDSDARLLKKQERVIRNRQAANLSRLRKKEYVERLERHLEQLKKENASLRQVNFYYKARCDKLSQSLESFQNRLKAQCKKLDLSSEDELFLTAEQFDIEPQPSTTIVDETSSSTSPTKPKIARITSVSSEFKELERNDPVISILPQPKPFAQASTGLLKSLSRCSTVQKSPPKLLVPKPNYFNPVVILQSMPKPMPASTPALPLMQTKPASIPGRRTMTKINAQLSREVHAMKNCAQSKRPPPAFSSTTSLFMVVGLLCLSFGWLGGSFELISLNYQHNTYPNSNVLSSSFGPEPVSRTLLSKQSLEFQNQSTKMDTELNEWMQKLWQESSRVYEINSSSKSKPFWPNEGETRRKSLVKEPAHSTWSEPSRVMDLFPDFSSLNGSDYYVFLDKGRPFVWPGATEPGNISHHQPKFTFILPSQLYRAYQRRGIFPFARNAEPDHFASSKILQIDCVVTNFTLHDQLLDK